MKNQPFVFIKPHAVENENVYEYICRTFSDHGMEWLEQGVIHGKEIREKGLIDQHYSVNAKVGTVRDPSILDLGMSGREAFKAAFSEEWDEVLAASRIKSGLVFQEDMGVDAESMNALWMGAQQLTKIAGGYYVALDATSNQYILNGFYPAIRAGYTQDDVSIKYGVMSFATEGLDWSHFREDVIGITNPAAAKPTSIRGFMYAHAEEYGLDVSYAENVIHASASPFEAVIEKTLWVADYDVSGDPLCSILADRGLGLDLIKETYRENPKVELCDGEVGTLIDVLEDKNTDRVAAILLELYG